MQPQKFLYGGLEILQEDRLKLWNMFISNNSISKITGWKHIRPILHHMTICFHSTMKHETYKWLLEHEGEVFNMNIVMLGFNDKACALQVVTDAISDNTIKHITIATNLDTDGKPVDSNNIKEWSILNNIPIIKGMVKLYYV